MNSSYLNSVRNIVLLSKPSRTIGLLLMVLFVFIMPQFSFGQKTWDGSSSTNWNTAANWTPSGVPTATDDVVVPNSNATNANPIISNTAVCGTLTIVGGNRANAVTISGNNSLTVSGAITIGAGTGFADNKIINVGTGSLSAASISMATTANDDRDCILSVSTGTINVSGNITMNGSTARNQVTFTAAGTLNIGGTMTGGGLTPSTGTVNYNNSGNQNIGNYTYNNLTLSGSGTKTFGAATTINNNFSIATNAIANLGTSLTHSAGVLTLGGEGTVPGSWGSTTSSATNKDNTYFAGTNGTVNNGCTAPTITTQPVALTLCENSGGSFTVATSATSPTYQWQYSADNINWTNIDAALNPYVAGYTTATFTLSNTPVGWTGYYVRCIVRSSTGCRVNSNSVLLTVSPVLSAPTIGTITQPTCSTATGSVVLNGLPTGSWILTRSPGSVTTTGTGTSTTITGLAAGTTYTYSVNGLSNGLKGEYYNNMSLTGSPTLTRTDATVNFDWVNGSPDASIPNDGFSVRWSGLVQPQYSETYTFSTRSDDGIRLWVNGVQIINNWTNHAATTDTGTITLIAGVKYNIVLEYFENTGQAVSQLSWSSASQALQIVPTTRLFPIGSCDSLASSNIVINAQPATPAVPTGTAAQSFCSSSNPTVASLTATGTAIQWYAAASGGSALATTTALVNGTHYYATQTTSGCESTTRFDVTVTINTAPTAPPVATAADNIGCTAATLHWNSVSNATGYYIDIATDSGFTSFVSGYNNFYIGYANYYASGLPSGTLYYRIRATNSCGVTTASSNTITFQTTTPSTPVVGAITQLNCALTTGSVVLSGLPAGSWTIYPGGITGSTTSTTVSGLATGTYNFTVSNGSCTSAATGDVAINPVITTTYNGSTWSTTPDLTMIGIVNSSTPITSNVNLCSCTVNTGINAVVSSGVTLKFQDKLTVSGTATLTFNDTASLVQINDAAINSGNIIYIRNTSSVRISDYTYWSSPVANQNLAISPAYTSGMFYSFNDFATPETWKSESASTIMTVGKGYIIRGQQIGSPTPPPPPSFYQATFTGTPHNGNKSIAIGPTGNSNLLGNPYPSAIDADKFLSANSTVIEGTIYFWTHNTAIQLASNITNGTAGSGAFAYTSDDYASYNLTGGVGTGTGNFVNGVEQIANIPTGEIAAGQAFFTTSLGTGTVTFNNAMRLGVGGVLLDNTQFFKTKNTKGKTAQIEKNRIWLNLTNAKGAFKQTLVGYITGATNAIDSRFDGESFDGQEFIDFYSVNQDKNLTIQGRALPFSENDEVPLGFRSTIEGPFSISIDQVDGSMTNQDIFIEDKLTNTIKDLKAGNYTFNTAAGTFNNRFVLRYNSKTLGITDLETQTNKVVVSVENKQIKINSLSETINKVAIFDLLGRQIYQNNKVDSSEFLTVDFSSSHQALIVKTTLQNGELVTNKIIF